MAYIFGAIAALVAICVYLYVSALALVYVSTPLSLIGAGLGLTAGLLAALVVVCVMLAGQSPVRAVRTPVQAAAKQLPRQRRDRFVRRDLAWPQYFVAQVGLDARTAASRLTSMVSATWDGATSNLGQPWLWVFGWPLLLPAGVAMVAFTAGVAAGAAFAAAVTAVVTVVAWTAGLLVAGLLRAADRTWQTVFRAGGTCPRCYEFSRIPAYRCPGAHGGSDRLGGKDLHRDVRPGRLGVLWRRCGCGRRLPTTVLRAAFAMQACCPRCTEPLPRGAAVDTDVRVPVFGAASAGKTHFLMASLVPLVRADGRGGVRVALADEHSERVFREYSNVVDAGGQAPKTNPGAPPVAVTVQLFRGRRRAMVHVFDAAGEALADSRQNADLVYLDSSRTLVFVLDPFSVPEVRDRYGGSYGELFARANPATEEPQFSYDVTVQRLRAHTVDTKRQRLAFVVTKGDLMAELPSGASPADSPAGVREWLVEHGLDNLVFTAERDFGEVRFYAVSAKPHAELPSPEEPFRWLLSTDRVPLPPTGLGTVRR
ncbi:hypothetical protein Val02_52090 [Virgisporangium aliadipatigenens]|uniref:Double-GTPase 2 domain-containing protein n=1 Tax=Virgisporangium aliadipatigenens TaxID=741659 RepID=A0A8J3YRA2_9ACTN|nr:hypothetical protein [Virgisporangium aliadipatigenens]GIJ48323.1 hypothetical protein Val02_52090 [Virgisporangium aliadipatigenens]